jgi:hypothetical protein
MVYFLLIEVAVAYLAARGRRPAQIPLHRTVHETTVQDNFLYSYSYNFSKATFF